MARSLAMAYLLTLAGLLPGATALRSEPLTVDLTMIDDKFIPDHLTFVHDVQYRLHLEITVGKPTSSQHRRSSPSPISTIPMRSIMTAQRL